MKKLTTSIHAAFLRVRNCSKGYVLITLFNPHTYVMLFSSISDEETEIQGS